MQTLTKLFSLEGKWEEEGDLGKNRNFSRYCTPATSSFSSFLLPLLPRARAVLLYVHQLGGGGVDMR